MINLPALTAGVMVIVFCIIVAPELMKINAILNHTEYGRDRSKKHRLSWICPMCKDMKT